jgi:hypothetical protein
MFGVLRKKPFKYRDNIGNDRLRIKENLTSMQSFLAVKKLYTIVLFFGCGKKILKNNNNVGFPKIIKWYL